MTAYYNENDPFAAGWLRELIKAGLIAKGEVDERSIEDVRPEDLRGFAQCHFFAGIGGWSYALRLAGWGDDRVAWTGSCPCQPFSVAGQQLGTSDKRHLWPELRRLISECLPSICFGEQVASKAGREWLSGVRADVEAMGYALGAADLCAASVWAPHIRQRLYWMAISEVEQLRRPEESREHSEKVRVSGSNGSSSSRRSGSVSGMAHADFSCKHERTSSGEQPIRDQHDAGSSFLGDSSPARLQGEWSEYRPSGERCSGLVGFAQAGVPEWNGSTVAVECSDGPRRISAEPDAFPLAHGVSRRMGKLRGYGNAIVPQVASAFIAAAMEAMG